MAHAIRPRARHPAARQDRTAAAPGECRCATLRAMDRSPTARHRERGISSLQVVTVLFTLLLVGTIVTFVVLAAGSGDGGATTPVTTLTAPPAAP